MICRLMSLSYANPFICISSRWILVQYRQICDRSSMATTHIEHVISASDMQHQSKDDCQTTNLDRVNLCTTMAKTVASPSTSMVIEARVDPVSDCRLSLDIHEMLIRCIVKSNLAQLIKLLENNPQIDANMKIGLRGMTLLHYAIESASSLQIIQYLINYGSQIMVQNNLGWSSLDDALYHYRKIQDRQQRLLLHSSSPHQRSADSTIISGASQQATKTIVHCPKDEGKQTVLFVEDVHSQVLDGHRQMIDEKQNLKHRYRIIKILVDNLNSRLRSNTSFNSVDCIRLYTCLHQEQHNFVMQFKISISHHSWLSFIWKKFTMINSASNLTMPTIITITKLGDNLRLDINYIDCIDSDMSIIFKDNVSNRQCLLAMYHKKKQFEYLFDPDNTDDIIANISGSHDATIMNHIMSAKYLGFDFRRPTFFLQPQRVPINSYDQMVDQQVQSLVNQANKLARTMIYSHSIKTTPHSSAKQKQRFNNSNQQQKKTGLARLLAPLHRMFSGKDTPIMREFIEFNIKGASDEKNITIVRRSIERKLIKMTVAKKYRHNESNEDSDSMSEPISDIFQLESISSCSSKANELPMDKCFDIEIDAKLCQEFPLSIEWVVRLLMRLKPFNIISNYFFDDLESLVTALKLTHQTEGGFPLKISHIPLALTDLDKTRYPSREENLLEKDNCKPNEQAVGSEKKDNLYSSWQDKNGSSSNKQQDFLEIKMTKFTLLPSQLDQSTLDNMFMVPEEYTEVSLENTFDDCVNINQSTLPPTDMYKIIQEWFLHPCLARALMKRNNIIASKTDRFSHLHLDSPTNTID